MNRTKLFSAALAASIATLSAAQASQVPVSYDPSRMDDPTYVSEVRSEVVRAARKACRKELAGTYRYSSFSSCVDDAVDRAMTKISA